MGKPLSIVYCQSCGSSHEPGRHSVGKRVPDSQKPETASIDAPKPSGDIPTVKKPPAKPKKKRKSLKEGFDKVHFQRDYMRLRRESDAAGFGGSRKRDDPDFNPEYMTVKQWLGHKQRNNIP